MGFERKIGTKNVDGIPKANPAGKRGVPNQKNLKITKLLYRQYAFVKVTQRNAKGKSPEN